MEDAPPSSGRSVTLVLCTLLHGFTHAFGAMLVPLYLLVVADLGLSGVGAASLVVTLYGLIYCLGSYPAGVLADRFDRRWLLGIGLIGNAVAIIGMGLTRQYEVLVLLGVVAGLFGTLFHPCANSLVPAHFPKSPGLAIGVLSVGSGMGFFAGPQWAGWRAETAGWHWGHVANWQKPCVELGIVGVVVGVAFLMLAKETRGKKDEPDAGGAFGSSSGGGSVPEAVLPARLSTEEVVMEYEPHVKGVHLGRGLFRRVLGIAAILGFRDFAGVAALSLASIYLQKAHGYTPRNAGFAVGSMMLLSILANPLAVYLTPGRRRLPSLAAVLVVGGLVLATVPAWGVVGGVVAFCVFQTFQLSSYAMSDAAMLERVPAELRGRVVGVFLTLAGTFASLGPWVMGAWTDALGGRSREPGAYWPIFAVLAVMMVVGATAAGLIARLSPTMGRDVAARGEGAILDA